MLIHSLAREGDSQGGGSPLVGGAALYAAWGEPARPGFPLWGNGKGDQTPCCRRLVPGSPRTAGVVDCRLLPGFASQFRTLNPSIQRLAPGGGTYRRSGRVRPDTEVLSAFSHTLSGEQSWPMQAISLPSSRSSIRIVDPRNPGRIRSLAICQCFPSHAIV